MIKKTALLICVLLVTTLSFADKVTPTIPVEVFSVQTKRVAESIIRIIEYNTELKQSLVIERMQTPQVKVVEKLEISKISVGNEIIDFKTAAGVYIENMKIEKGVVTFLVDYIYGGKGGGSILVKCSMNANNNKLSELICSKK